MVGRRSAGRQAEVLNGPFGSEEEDCVSDVSNLSHSQGQASHPRAVKIDKKPSFKESYKIFFQKKRVLLYIC